MNFISEKYESMKQKWMKKTPLGKWLVLHGIGDFALRLLGIHVYTDNKVYFWTYSSGILSTIYLVLVTYTAAVYTVEDNFKECLKSFCISSAIVSVYES